MGVPQRRFPVRALALAVAAAALLPGVVFAVWYVRIQCFPAQHVIKSTPAALGLPYETFRRTGADGVTTVGWYIPPPASPAAAVLLIHGHGGTRESYIDQATNLHRAGFGVATFDLRHHGEADSAICTFGLREAGDVRPWLDLVQARPEHRGRKVGLLGYSMGAATALRAASLYADVAAVVADSPFASLSDELRWRMSRLVPAAMVDYGWFFTLTGGCLATQNAPGAWEVSDWLRLVAPRPVFLIHGRDDTNIPCTATERLAALSLPGVQSWLVPGAGHTLSREVAGAEYGRRVAEFFRTSLN